MLRRKTFHAANANTAMQTKFVAAYGTRGLSQKLADDLAASNCRLGKLATASARRLKLTAKLLMSRSSFLLEHTGGAHSLERWVACPGRTNASPKHL